MKQRAKRLMALFMAGVFTLSTCMTSGPYTVLATEEAALAESDAEKTTADAEPTTEVTLEQTETTDAEPTTEVTSEQTETTDLEPTTDVAEENKTDNSDSVAEPATQQSVTEATTEQPTESVNPGTQESGDVAQEESYEYTVELPAQIDAVPWSKDENNADKVQIVYGTEEYEVKEKNVDSNIQKYVELPTLIEGQPEIKCDNYVFSETIVDKVNRKIKVGKATPNAEFTEISGDNAIVVGGENKYTVGVNSAWKKYVTWTVDGTDISGVEVVADKDDTTKATLTAKGFSGNDKDVTVKAKIEVKGTVYVEKDYAITVHKKSSLKSINVTKPEQKSPWQVQVELEIVADEGLAGEKITVTTGEQKNGVKPEKEATIGKDGKVTVEWNLTKYQEKITFYANYVGNEEYAAGNVDISYDMTKADQKFKIIPIPGSVTYGDSETEIAYIDSANSTDITNNENAEWTYEYTGIDGGALVVRMDENNQYGIYFTPSVTENGKRVCMEAKDYSFTITRKNSDYNPACVDLKVKIEKKPVKIIDTAKENETRIYDGKTDIQLTAVLNTEDFLQDDLTESGITDFKVFTTGNMQKPDSGSEEVTYNEFNFPAGYPEKITNNYEIKTEQKTTVTVEKRSLEVSVCTKEGKPIERQYTDYKNLENADDVRIEVKNFADGESADTLKGYGYVAPKVKINSTAVNENVKLNSTITNAIIPDYTKAEATKNYKFVDGESGSIILRPQEITDIKAILSVDNASSTKAYQRTNNKEIYYGQGESEIAWKIDNQFNSNVTETSDLNAIYNAVEVRHRIDIDIPEEGASLSYSPKENDETIYVRLKASEGNGVTQWCEMTLINDTTAPETQISLNNTPSVYDFASVITFGLFSSKQVNAEIGKITDGEAGAGVKSWKYYKIDLRKDTQFTKDEVKNKDFAKKIGDVLKGEGGKNIAVTEQTQSYFEGQTIALGTDEKTKEGNFVVFVVVEDNVGNEAVYGSNGVIIDRTAPQIFELQYANLESGDINNIEHPEEPDNTNVDFIQNKNTKAVLYAHAKEDKTVFSGIKEITADVYKENEKVNTGREVLYKEDKEEASLTLNELNTNYEEVSTERLKDGKIIQEIASGECVRYKIDATVLDKAGNKQKTSKEFVLDTLVPDITDNNIYLTSNPKADVKSREEGKNTTYYSNENVTIKTSVTERFIDNANIRLVLTKDDGEKTETINKSLSEWLTDGSGIATVTVDEGKVNNNSNESKRTIEFTVTANEGLESKFSYYVIADDYSGNYVENTPINFVVDNVKPEISDNTIQNSTDDHFDNKADINTKVYYSNEGVVVTTEVTDRFIDNEHITISLTKDQKEYTKSVKEWCESPDLGIKCEYKEPDDNKDASVARTITFTVPTKDNEKDNEGDFTYKVSAVDYAENQAENQTTNFCIDTTKPEVQVTYSPIQNGTTLHPINTSNSIYYLNQNYNAFEVNVKVIEKHLKANDTDKILSNYQAIRTYLVNGDIGSTETTDIAVSASRKGSNSAVNLNKGIVSDIAEKASWLVDTQNSTEYNYTFTCTTEANYEFPDITITDLAGNPSGATGNAKITLDRTVPEGTVKISDLISTSGKDTSWTNRFLDSLTFGLYGKTFVTASISNHDETTGGSGIGEKKYYLATSRMTKEALNQLNENQWTSYRGNITMAENRNYIVYEKVVDKAGNLAYYSSDRVIVDHQDPQPEVTITPTTPGWGKGVYSASDNPGFDVYVVDPAGSDGSCAGLAEIKYTIKNGTTGYQENGTLASYAATDAPVATYKGHVTIDPEKFYSNDVQVTVEATDHSTNGKTTETQSIKVDNKAPIVTFSFDQSDVHNGKYYNNDKTLTITVDERNFDESYQPQVTSTAGGGYSVSGWSHNGEIHTATVTFSGDSDYTVTYDCFDLAGNKSNTEKLDEFTVDKTKPVIQVSYDNNSALNNNYYKEARTATITITEHNFNPGEVTVTTTAQLDGAAASAPGVSGWSGSGDTHVATVSYSADADYTFTISATDLASNVSDPYATESFTVDQTKPTVEITNIEDRSANNGEVAPVITLNDINFDSGKTVVHLTGANKGEVDTTGMYTSTASNKGQTLTFYNFKENMDDIYTLTAETTDKAGNQYSTSKIFSVNRDGSTYLYDDYTEELIKNGYTNDPKNLVVSEINVDTLTFQELTVSENGTQKTLEQNKDFEVSESGSDVSWKEYKYTINASNFENEGDYNVSIYSEDRATNVTTNTAKSKDILFAVDKTSPVISLANIEDGGRYKVESQTFTANVDDNMALDKVEYYVDDELKQTFDADEVSANGGSLELSVDSSNTFQNVSVKAYDKANNEATTASVDVLVSANTWVQFYNNKPVFYGTIGGGVAAVAAAVAAGVHFSGAAAGTAAAAGKTAAGAGIFLAGKKRKKDEE